MTTTVFGLKNCDTCKKALKALSAEGADVTFVDIRSEADLPSKLPGWVEAIGPALLVNTRSTTWRSLDEDQRARRDHDTIGLLTENPTLIKRPVISASGQLTVGWPPKP